MVELTNELSIPRALRLFQRKRVPANCLAGDAIGACVFVTGPKVGQFYQVATADPAVAASMPAIGVIVAKSAPTVCTVQLFGEVTGIYAGFTTGSLLFVGAAGTPSHVAGSIPQSIGIAISTDIALLFPDYKADISAAQHETLRQLIHFIDEGPGFGFLTGAFKQVVGGLFPTSIVWWESSAMLKKIVEKTITRTGGPATLLKPTPITWSVYDVDGVTVLHTISDAVAYTGVAETSRTRTIS